jgi:hypothetical protein
MFEKLYALLNFLKLAACPTHLILPWFISVTKQDEKSRSNLSTIPNHLPHHSIFQHPPSFFIRE